jgi:hypothetical protein
MMVDEKFFTSTPYSSGHNQLSREFRNSLKNDLIVHVEQCSDMMQRDFLNVKSRVEQFDVNRKFSPIPYLLLAELKIAQYNKQTNSSVLDLLMAIEKLTDEDLYNSELTVSSAMSEVWEYSYISRLRKTKVEVVNEDDVIEIHPIFDNIDIYKYTIIYTINLLEEIDKNIYMELLEYVSRIKLFDGKGEIASASIDNLGCIYMRVPQNLGVSDSNYFLEHLIHGVSHLHLYHLMLFDELFHRDDAALYPAPMLKERRPLYDVFHATFVCSRIARVFSLRKNDNESIKLRDIFIKRLINGLNIIEKNAVLTPKGASIVNAMKETAFLS